MYDPKMDWGVAHLYEHLLIQSFRAHVEASGYSPYLYGWVGGETFQGVLFIDYGFYNPALEELFVKFMQNTPRISLADLENEILRIQAEDRVLVDISNKKRLVELLKEMDKTTFTNVNDGDEVRQIDDIAPSHPPFMKEKRSAKSFKQITVAVGLPQASLEEKATFLRMTPIIFDAIDSALFSKGLYQNEVSWPVHNKHHDSMLAHAIYTVKKGTVSNKDIEKIAHEALASIELRGHEKEIKYYADGFVGTPNWHTFPIDYYRYTGIISSKRRIAELLKVENLQGLMGKLQIQVTRTTPDHFDVVQ